MANQKGASSTSCHREKEAVTAISESLPSNSAELIFMKNSFVFLQIKNDLSSIHRLWDYRHLHGARHSGV